MNLNRTAVLIATGVMGVAALFATVSQATSRPKQRFFLSPSRNISCELDANPSHAVSGSSTLAYCQTLTPARSVTMTAAGRVSVCTGDRCLGNPPENASILKYGAKSSLGPFTCQSLQSGVVCRVSSGKGFKISRSGVSRL